MSTWKIFVKGGVLFCLLCVIGGILTYADTTHAAEVQSSPANFQTTVSTVQPGDILVLEDGSYGSYVMRDVHGTASAPVIIRAKNDGNAHFDLFWIENASHIVVEGLVIQSDSPGTLKVAGSHNITLRRVSVYGGIGNSTGNISTANFFNVRDVLCEDCIAGGFGRYQFLAYDSQSITFRRCYAKWQYNRWEEDLAAPRVAFGIYGTENAVLENVIAFNAFPVGTDNQWGLPPTDGGSIYAGVFITAADHNLYVPQSVSVRGSLFSSNFHGGIAYGGYFDGNRNQVVPHLSVTDSVFFDHRIQDCPAGVSNCPTWTRGYGLELNAESGTVARNTFVDNSIGIRTRQKGPSFSVSQNLFVENDTALSGIVSAQTYSNFWKNTSIGSSEGVHSTSINPQWRHATYGTGAYLFTPPASGLSTAGQEGTPIGANVLYQIQDGVTTDTPLWPWPMEERLFSEAGVSATWEENGGIWRSLEGVYPGYPHTSEGILFPDVPVSHTFYSPIRALVEDNIVRGFEDGTFKPDQPVNRGQMAKFIKNAYRFDTDTSCSAFPDVGTDNTFYNEITTLKCRGVINGFEDGRFKPELNVTRGQAMKFVMQGLRVREGDSGYLIYTRSTQVFSDVPVSYTFYEQIMAAEESEIVGGYGNGTFGPEDETSRGAMSKMVDNARSF